MADMGGANAATGRPITFGGESGSAMSPVAAGLPTGGGSVSELFQDFMVYLGTIWLQEHDVDQDAQALAHFDIAAPISAYRSHRRAGRRVPSGGGFDLEQSYLVAQLVARAPLTCLHNAAMPGVPTGRIARLWTLPPAELVAEVLRRFPVGFSTQAPVAGQLDRWRGLVRPASALVYDGSVGHCVLLSGADQATRPRRIHRCRHGAPRRGARCCARRTTARAWRRRRCRPATATTRARDLLPARQAHAHGRQAGTPLARGIQGDGDVDTAELAKGRDGKANFDDIYLARDPREYFRVLVGLDYVIPDLAKVAFRSLIEYRGQALAAEGDHAAGRPLKVIDIGSSYGINSAVVNYSPDIERLARRYGEPAMYRVPTEELILLDRNYFASWPKLSGARFVGVDTSAPAISYGKAVGLLDDGVTSNLEETDPSAADQRILAGADLVISTGCVGYVTEKTFGRVLSCQRSGAQPIVASFVLRMYGYDKIAACLADHGLVTEKLEGVTFVQRRFKSPQECAATIDRLDGMGIDPTCKESDGLLHAELFVSRPKADVEVMPLSEIVSINLGERWTRGRRFKQVV
jgi:hypothetical protein